MSVPENRCRSLGQYAMGGPGNRVSDLYHQALERAPEGRSAFLQAACGGDDDLRAEVESLLRYEPQAAGFLLRPPGPDDDAPAPDRDSMIDRQLGPYTILALLGAGGMGDVYRARDTKLGREVAIKILPPHLTAEPERRGRFAREARLLATLNHPNIGAIYGLEESDGVTALVLELVEGETLADRLARGPLSVPQAMALARQIADALDAAHEKGIVHRDLKPANIVLQGDGASSSGDVRVKVLDFGLAKSLAVGADAQATAPPGTSLSGTEDGRILGTPVYMSPEQARGLQVDKRADIWAFGCVLFEMLSAKRAFDGDTISDTLVRVLDREPDWSALPDSTPRAIRTLLERCVRKDPSRRLHDIADALIEIDDATRGGNSELALHAARTPASSKARRRVVWTASAIAVVVLALAGAWVQWWPGRAPVEVSTESLQFTVPLPLDARGQPFGINSWLSPDGTHLAMRLLTADKPGRLWLAALRSGDMRELPATERVGTPFWSPDGRRLAFFEGGKLKSVAVDGSGPIDICDLGAADSTFRPSGEPGAWSEQGLILYRSSGPGIGLQKVSTADCRPAAATELAEGEGGHGWPAFLPDGEHFLFLAYGADDSNVSNVRQLRVGSVRSVQSKPLGPIRSSAVYASGYILFVDGGLMAQRFDVTSLRRLGEPRMLVEGVRANGNGRGQRGQFSASHTGLVAYEEWEPLGGSSLTWFDRKGMALGTAGRGDAANLSLSPDDRRLAVSRTNPEVWGGPDIYVVELTRGGDARRLTTDPAAEYDPAWSPDGAQIIFNSNRGSGRHRLYRRAADGSGTDELLADVPGNSVTPAWSPDGKVVIFAAEGGLWIQPVEPGATAVPFGRPGEGEGAPSFSPDGRWVVYHSRRTGRLEIYVRPYPSGDRDYKVSIDGGGEPRWRRQEEIVFLSLDGRMMAARVTTGRTFESAVPQQLFATGKPGLLFDGRPFDVTRDGQQFMYSVGPRNGMSIRVLTNWPARLAGSGSR
jgi:eukaryotic-like serine/threonine-protein kinase